MTGSATEVIILNWLWPLLADAAARPEDSGTSPLQQSPADTCVAQSLVAAATYFLMNPSMHACMVAQWLETPAPLLLVRSRVASRQAAKQHVA